MRTITSIQGAMASGKTTLAHALEDAYPELHENWYKQFPVYSIDTTAKTPEQVRQAAIHQLSVTGILGRGSEI